MPCSPTTPLGNPGYFNIYSNGFETIWGYFVRMETQKWVKICIFVDSIHTDALCFWLGVSIHNATGNLAECPFYRRVGVRNTVFWVVRSGPCCISDEPMAGRCIPVSWLRSLWPRKLMKIISLPRSSFPASQLLSLLLSSFLASSAVRWGPTTGHALDIFCHGALSLGKIW